MATKLCRICGAEFTKPPKISWAQWDMRTACGKECGNTTPLRERLESFAVKSPDGCWVWQGAVVGDGYGEIQVVENGRKVSRRAHRLMFREANGFDPGKQFVLHSCDNPPCINPAHLFLGDHAANMADRLAKGRYASISGERSNLSKLSARDVEVIRNGGEALTLAKQFGVSRRLINMIKSGKIWKSANA